VGCLQPILDEDSLGACEACGLPVCAATQLECQALSRHARNECAMLVGFGGRGKTMSLMEDLGKHISLKK